MCRLVLTLYPVRSTFWVWLLGHAAFFCIEGLESLRPSVVEDGDPVVTVVGDVGQLLKSV